MRRTLIAITFLAGCAYSSSYKQTNFDVQGKPTAAAKVKVYANADAVKGEWVEIGRFRGRAPSEQEVVDAAKTTCGQNGASLAIYVARPKSVEDTWELEAICGVGLSNGKKVSKK